jgi:esterase/lipase superfamily enzyme
MEWLRPKDEAPAESPIEYDVFFGTNRKPVDPSHPTEGFLNERGSALSVGRCRISVPKTHKFGSNGSKWLSLFTRTGGDTLRVLEIEAIDALAFDLRVNAALSDFDCKPQNLLYIHGFNVSFEDAMMQAGQFGVDLKIPGRTFVFSWPSAARLLGHYAADEAAVEASIPFLEQFVAMIRRHSPEVPLNVLVHSMGCRAVVRLLDKLANGPATGGAPIRQVIFAAPDVDHDVFAEAIGRSSGVSSRTTLYMTRADLALQVSELIHRYPRAGLAPPMVAASGVDIVLVEDFELLSLGHGYHSKAAAVLHDMFHLIRYNSSPRNRPAIREARSESGQIYWRLSVA